MIKYYIPKGTRMMRCLVGGGREAEEVISTRNAYYDTWEKETASIFSGMICFYFKDNKGQSWYIWVWPDDIEEMEI
jgi:hypothetical protein